MLTHLWNDCLYGAIEVLIYSRRGNFRADLHKQGTGPVLYVPALLTTNPSTSLPRGKNGRVLLLLWKTPPDFEKPNVTIQTDDPSVYPDRTSIGYLHRIENTAKRYNPPAKIVAGGREYDFSGIKFYRVDYQFPEPTLTFNTAITGQVGNCEITFQFVARTQREIETFVQSINAVRFSKP